mmetsp:Transcript_84346/g.243861  ORF Transcript_84346/g.243861 Transcript_84346/m.243861 type:complete len:676 (-) Transcript_84346:1281-3308(-)
MESDLDLQALCGVHALRRLQLRAGMWQQGAKDRVEVLVDFDPCSPQSVQLLLVQIADHSLDLALVVQDDVSLRQKILVLLLGLLEHDHGLLVDVLAQRLLLRCEIIETALVVLVAVCLEVEIGALLAEKSLLFLDPWVLLLHARDHNRSLLVVLLELLDLVADPFLLNLLVLALRLVRSELRVEVGQGLVERGQLGPQRLQLLAYISVRRARLLQCVFELLHLSGHFFMALAGDMVLALLGLHLVAQHLELDVGLLRLLPLLLQLLLVLLRFGLQPLDLLLEVLDALLASGLQGLDIFLQLLRHFFEPLLLLRHRLYIGLDLYQLGPHLMQRLLRDMMLARVDALVDQGQLVLLALQLPIQLHVLRRGGLHPLQLGCGLLVLLVLHVDALLHLGQLLQPHEEVAALGRRAAGDGARRVVQVTIFGDGTDPHVRVEGHLLRCFGRVADQEASEDVLHRTLHLALEADNLHRQVQVAAAGDVLRLLHDVLRDRGVHDLVQRDDGHSALQLPALEERLAGLLVVDHNEEKPPTGADLERPVVAGEVGPNVEELGDDALHLRPVEAPVGVGVLKVEAAHVRPQLIEPLLHGMQSGLALPRRGNELVVALGVELHVGQRGPALGDEILGDGLLLGESLALLLAVGQDLFHLGDALLVATDGERFLLQLCIHLRQLRLRVQ